MTAPIPRAPVRITRHNVAHFPAFVVTSGPEAIRGTVWKLAGPVPPGDMTGFFKRVTPVPRLPWWKRLLLIGWGDMETLDLAWLEPVQEPRDG